MAALPRTARAPRRQQQQQPQLQQQSTGDEASSSPRAVLASFPLAQRRPSKRDPLTRPEGHALDLVHLLSAGWWVPAAPPHPSAASPLILDVLHDAPHSL